MNHELRRVYRAVVDFMRQADDFGHHGEGLRASLAEMHARTAADIYCKFEEECAFEITGRAATFAADYPRFA